MCLIEKVTYNKFLLQYFRVFSSFKLWLNDCQDTVNKCIFTIKYNNISHFACFDSHCYYWSGSVYGLLCKLHASNNDMAYLFLFHLAAHAQPTTSTMVPAITTPGTHTRMCTRIQAIDTHHTWMHIHACTHTHRVKSCSNAWRKYHSTVHVHNTTLAPVVLSVVVTISVVTMVTVITIIAVILSCFLFNKHKATSKWSPIRLMVI